MLIQRVLCRSWHRQITECKYTKRTFLLHQQHVRCRPTHPPQNWLLRPIRTSPPNNKPRVDSLNIKPFEQFDVHGGSVPPSNVIKAVVFAGTFTMGCFMSATIMEYENTRNTILKKARESRLAWGRRSQTEHNSIEELRQTIAQYWNQLTPGERVFAPLCALNLIVFGLWRVPTLRNTMMTYFCSNPAGRAVCWPMFLSTFSHYSAFHLFANMYVLHSFSSAAVMSMGKEQFLAVYLSAGVLASLGSIMYKAVTSQAGLSIGASGAIMAILAYVCSKFPDTQLSILFLPTLTFSAGAAIKVIMGIDLAGCIMGWKFFDHAAHLGGAMFGIFWSYFGAEMWQKRITFLSMYHDWRKAK